MNNSIWDGKEGRIVPTALEVQVDGSRLKKSRRVHGTFHHVTL